MAESFFINLGENRINVHQIGKGKSLLIAFHGFEDDLANYRLLGDWLSLYYTILIPDLPFHGRTEWKQGILTLSLLEELLMSLLKIYSVKRCSLLGYSMGGRLAICLGERMSNVLDHLILIAPEGLRKNFWFNFSTGTLAGGQLFYTVVSRPKMLMRGLRFLKLLGLIKQNRAIYFTNLLENKKSRKKVYDCWMCFKELRPQNIRTMMADMGQAVHLIFGKNDHLIPAPSKQESKNWAPASVSIIPAGHNLCINKITLQTICFYTCPPPKHKSHKIVD